MRRERGYLRGAFGEGRKKSKPDSGAALLRQRVRLWILTLAGMYQPSEPVREEDVVAFAGEVLHELTNDEKILELKEVSVMTGNGFTTTVTEAVAEHPLASVPVTVYVVVVEGFTVMVPPVCPPGDQL